VPKDSTKEISQMSDELRRINGIGKILEKRLLENGIESFAQLAGIAPEQLSTLTGMDRASARRTVDQAARLSNYHGAGLKCTLDMLLPTCERLVAEVQGLSLGIKERDEGKFSGKHRHKIEKEIEKILCSLRNVRSSLIEDLTRVEHGLTKADRKIARLEPEDDPRDIEKGLRKARRKLEKALDDQV
jgi:predicted RecB family nuclease